MGTDRWDISVSRRSARSGLPRLDHSAVDEVVAAGAGDAKIAMIDPRDVGAAAAVLLTEDGHDGQTYTVTGPAAITYHDVAEHLSVAAGREISFVDVPGVAAHGAMLKAGAPRWLADNLVTLFGKLRAGAGAEVTDTVQALTGRPPHTFAQWAAQPAPRAIFGEPG